MWNKEQTFLKSEDYFNSFIEDVNRAQKNIRIEVFILEEGKLWSKIAPHLQSASKRGVKIEIVIDGLSAGFMNKLKEKNSFLDIRVFQPLWVQILFLRQRNHRKLLIIDDQVAYVGSSNLHDKTLEWRESGVRVSGSGVKHLINSFYNTWNRSKGSSIWEKIESKFGRAVMSFKKSKSIVVTDSFGRMLVKYFWVNKISKSQKRIWISTPYFLPPPLIYNGLLKAAKNGVDVRIIVPSRDKIDYPFIKTIERYYVEKLVKNGAKVYEYLPEMLHSKVSLFDKYLVMGSSNWNYRSRTRDLELDVVLEQRTSLDSMEKALLQDMSNSRELLKESFQEQNIFERIFTSFLMKIKDIC